MPIIYYVGHHGDLKHRERWNSASTTRKIQAACKREFKVVTMDTSIGSYRGTHTYNFLVKRAYYMYLV